MYMRGLSDIADGSDSFWDAPPVTYTPMEAPAVDPSLYNLPPVADSQSPTPTPSGSSWMDTISSALKTYASVDIAKHNSNAATQAAQYNYASQLAARGYPPNGMRLPGITYPAGYSPLPPGAVRASASGLSTESKIGLVGLVISVLYMMRS